MYSHRGFRSKGSLHQIVSTQRSGHNGPEDQTPKPFFFFFADVSYSLANPSLTVLRMKYCSRWDDLTVARSRCMILLDDLVNIDDWFHGRDRAAGPCPEGIYWYQTLQADFG
jgi:hypothetical protein